MASSYGQANAWSQTAGQVAGIAANAFANYGTAQPQQYPYGGWGSGGGMPTRTGG